MERRFSRLEDWLQWQETLHPRSIDLGLDRLQVVAARLGLSRPAPTVITVGGTNGKGSCVALLESVLTASGRRVGSYTSPHLLRYNERIRIDGVEVEDDLLCDAFDRIDRARGDISITYFEFGTLAALDLFQRAKLEVALLEVGLGGRLDAVNLVSADVALVVTIDLDHLDWLGPDRDRVGREKAGIFRRGRPAVVADRQPPAGLLDAADAIGPRLLLRGQDYSVASYPDGSWDWHSSSGADLSRLPAPALPGPWQLDNAAAVVTVLHCLAEVPTRKAIEQGLRTVGVPGRQQWIEGRVPMLLDVAHNAQALRALTAALRQQQVPGRTLAVLGMLADKDLDAAFTITLPVIDGWYLATLGGARGQPSEALAKALQDMGDTRPRQCCADVASALAAARTEAEAGDRIVVFGSFLTVAGAMEVLAESNPPQLTPPARAVGG